MTESNKKGKGKELFDEELIDNGKKGKTLWLLVGLNKMSGKPNVKPVRLSLPHPWRRADNEETAVCLMTKDPQRLYKDLVNPMGLSSITKISGISKLRTKFKPFEAKRQLCDSFDLFLADSSILPLLPKVLGKVFFEKKKQPVPVTISPKSKPETIKRELQEAIESTYLFLSGGSSLSIRVATSAQNAEEIAANIMSVLKQLSTKLPGGLDNIRTIHLKSQTSVSLPIYSRDA